MNVYDFDNTIYDGESIVDFYRFLLPKKPSLLRLLPKIVHMLVRYKLCLISEQELDETARKYAGELVPFLSDATLVSEFWDRNAHKIKRFYLERKKTDDVILSANCGLFIKEICTRLGIQNVIASEINIESGRVVRLCFRGNKPKFFREHFPNEEIDEFFTDSMNDDAMFKMAKKVYLVKGNKIKEMI